MAIRVGEHHVVHPFPKHHFLMGRVAWNLHRIHCVWLVDDSTWNLKRDTWLTCGHQIQRLMIGLEVDIE